jgi:hypothetical protein
VGTKVAYPEPGDIVVFWRESPQSWKGHVGIFTGISFDKNGFIVLVATRETEFRSQVTGSIQYFRFNDWQTLKKN